MTIEAPAVPLDDANRKSGTLCTEREKARCEAHGYGFYATENFWHYCFRDINVFCSMRLEDRQPFYRTSMPAVDWKRWLEMNFG